MTEASGGGPPPAAPPPSSPPAAPAASEVPELGQLVRNFLKTPAGAVITLLVAGLLSVLAYLGKELRDRTKALEEQRVALCTVLLQTRGWVRHLTVDGNRVSTKAFARLCEQLGGSRDAGDDECHFASTVDEAFLRGMYFDLVAEIPPDPAQPDYCK